MLPCTATYWPGKLQRTRYVFLPVKQRPACASILYTLSMCNTTVMFERAICAVEFIQPAHIRSWVLIRCTASSVSFLLPKPVSLKYPWPLGPNPAPGVPTRCASLSSLSKNSHESRPEGVLSHTYGELTPP